MKASLFLLFAFFAIALCGRLQTRAYQQKCGSIQCEKSGKECGFVDLKTYTVGTGCINADTEYCNITKQGRVVDDTDRPEVAVGQCITYATVGQSCQGRECGLGLVCTSTLSSAVCVAAPQENATRDPGQPCGSSNIDCRYYSPSSGSENTCVNGVCKFDNDGSTCTPGRGNHQCNYKSSCVSTSPSGLTGVCQSRFAAGSACIANLTDLFGNNVANAQCQEGLNCIPNSITVGAAGTCKAIYSQKEKGACKDASDCKDGVCNDPDGPVDTVYWGVCADYKKTSTLNKRCADDDDCTTNNGESCVCVDDEKSVCKNTDFNRKYYKDIKKYEECTEEADKKCAGLEERQQDKCYYTECKKEFCKLYKKGKKEGVNFAGSDPKLACAVVQICDASALFTSFPLLVAFAAIVLLLQ